MSEFSLLVVVHVASAVMLAGLLVLVLSSRQEPLAPWLAGVFAALLLWTIGYALELAAHDLPTKLEWADVQFIAATVLPVLWLCAMRTAAAARPLPRWVMAGLWLVALAIVAGVFTNPGGLFRGRPGLDVSGSLTFVAADYGPFYYFVWVPFAWGLLTASLVTLGRAARHGRGLVRWRSRLLLIATLLPMIAGALYSVGALPWRNFNPAMASLTISSLFCAVALLRYRLLKLTPLARDTVIEQLTDGIVVSDAGGLLTDYNPAASAILPELTPGAVGMRLDDVLAGREGFARARAAAREVAEQEARNATTEGSATDDEESATLAVTDAGASGDVRQRYYCLRVAPVIRPNGRSIGEALVLHDVTRRVELYRSARRLATTDELTGLLARREFLDLSDEQMARCRRQARSAAVLLIDLDHFKLVNDLHGHAAGDQVLRAVAAGCAEQLRAFDLLGRYGGDEMCAFLPGVGRDLALAVAERLRAAVSGLSVWCGSELIRVTVSVGVAICDQAHPSGVHDLIASADAALYQAKRTGRNRVAIACPNEDAPVAGSFAAVPTASRAVARARRRRVRERL